MIVTFSDVEKTFGKTTVLANVSLTLEGAQTYFLTGASGSGKTTLLRLIAGLDDPSKGTVTRSSEKISYAFQEPRLFPQLTVRENLLAITPRVDAAEILTALDLTDSMGKYPHELSGGMKKRAAVARALAAEADLYLLDEPSSGQDADHTAMVANAIRCYTEGATVVIATHDTALIGAIKAKMITVDNTGVHLK